MIVFLGPTGDDAATFSGLWGEQLKDSLIYLTCFGGSDFLTHGSLVRH